MELTAVIRALEALKRGCDVEIYTDSQYVKNGIETWIHGWKRNGWKTADRKPVKNADLWRELDALAAQHDIKWHWVKGHTDDPGNERADALANRGVESGVARSAARRSAGARSISSRRANTRISFSACLSPRACATAMPVAIGGKRFVVAARRRRAPCRRASTRRCSPGPARRRARGAPRRAPRRRPSGTRCRAKSAAARHPCPRRASSRSSRAPRTARRPSQRDQSRDALAGFAVDPAHRIDDLAIVAIDLAFDRRVEPAFRRAAIDDPLRELERRVGEREDRVVAVVRRVDGLAIEPERASFLPDGTAT